MHFSVEKSIFRKHGGRNVCEDSIKEKIYEKFEIHLLENQIEAITQNLLFGKLKSLTSISRFLDKDVKINGKDVDDK